MNKNFLYIFLLLAFTFSACEKDDICLLPNTPKLVLRFYDNSNPTTLKSPSNLSVWADGKDTISNYKSVSLDSIAIPLNINTTETIYNLKTSLTGNKADRKYNTITIKYTTEDVFVSRSCGFKTIFNNVTVTSDNNWIQSFTPAILTTINNETAAHVKIFH